MIKSVFCLLVVGVALMPFVDGKKVKPLVTKGVATQSNLATSDLIVYTLNSANGQTCHIKMLTKTVGGVAKLAVDTACEGVSAGLGNAVSWRPVRFGMVENWFHFELLIVAVPAFTDAICPLRFGQSPEHGLKQKHSHQPAVPTCLDDKLHGGDECKIISAEASACR